MSYCLVVLDGEKLLCIDGVLTHWGRVKHICIGKQTIIGSDNGLSPGRHQAIIWTNAGILLIGPLGTNFNENSIRIQTFSFKKMHLKMSSAKWHSFCRGLNLLNNKGNLVTGYSAASAYACWFVVNHSILLWSFYFCLWHQIVSLSLVVGQVIYLYSRHRYGK